MSHPISSVISISIECEHTHRHNIKTTFSPTGNLVSVCFDREKVPFPTKSRALLKHGFAIIAETAAAPV